MVDQLQSILMGWKFNESLAELVAVATLIVGILLLAIIVNFIAKKIILTAIKKIVSKTKNQWDDIFVRQKVFQRLSHVAPALVIYALASVPFPNSDSVTQIIQRFATTYMILVGILVINSALTALTKIYQRTEVSREKPIQAYVQIAKIFLYVVAGILVISTLLNKSPWVMLSGLGAMTAIIMLVFKDTILGFVASIQLSSYDMVRRGDWIEMKKYGVDGDVLDVSVNTVKVQNFDKTITTIPTYSLIDSSFKNWRGMSESGGRRIKRAINIDMNSAKFCTEEMIKRFSKFDFIKDYVAQKQKEVVAYNKDKNIDLDELVNGRRLTNLGTFRAYIQGFLRNHPKIHTDGGFTFLVRQLAPTQTGLPIEIYVFSNDINWVNYEGIQADIFDHLLAALPEFDLRVFQDPTGVDVRASYGVGPLAKSA